MLPKGSPGAFCVSASFRQGKALVLKDNGMFRGSIAVVSADIFAAEVDLISDTFALAGVAGFAGIDGNGVSSFGHEILLSCCPVAVDAAIVSPTFLRWVFGWNGLVKIVYNFFRFLSESC